MISSPMPLAEEMVKTRPERACLEIFEDSGHCVKPVGRAGKVLSRDQGICRKLIILIKHVT